MDNLRIGQQSLLGYLPALVIKNIIEKKIDIGKKNFPIHYNFTTVALFADISGFTKLSEAFAKKGRIGPEFLAFSLNRYMEQLVSIIGKNGGDIFKFAGDALLVIWPETTGLELAKSCRRAIQCALDIQAKLHDVEIAKNKKLSIKIGIGVGDVRILVVGGQFNRCEYLSVGEAMASACDSEGNATCGGQTICTEKVYELIQNSIEADLIENEDGGGHGHGGGGDMKFYLIQKLKGERVAMKADAYLMRTQFSLDRIRANFDYLKAFIPMAISSYLAIEKESWSKEIRLLTIMFMILKVDLKQINSKEGLDRIQNIIKTVQKGLYSTRGALNKFLMDDKGSVILAAWGLPPGSNSDDHVKAIFGALTLIKELKKLKCGSYMGITTGTCFSGVCGNIGNRREYSLLGEVVNLSARHMQKAIYWAKDNKLDYCFLVDERTKDLCQNKISFQYVTSGELKGFQNVFDFYTTCEIPKESMPTNPFPMLRTHRYNCTISTAAPNNSYIDPNAAFNKSLFMIGREEEKKMFNEILDRVYLDGDSDLIVIKGVFGSGKTLFIRKCLYDYFIKSKTLSHYFKGVRGNPVIFVEFQRPDLSNVVCNGLKEILKDMYKCLIKEAHKKTTIKANINDEFFNVECDIIGEILFDTKAYLFLNFLEEIFDTNFQEHYTFDPLNEIKPPPLFEIKSRDQFFEPRIHTPDQEKAIKFFVSNLVVQYKRLCIEQYQKDAPLFIIIEDSHLIDDISCKILARLSMENELNSTLIICTYQTPIHYLVDNSKDKFSKYDELFENTSIYMSPLNDFEEINKLIKDSLKFKQNIVVDRIEKHLIYLILIKSFNGIPLFILEIVENMVVGNKFAQFAGNELITTYELEIMEKTLDWSEFPIPIIIEKIVGALLDRLSFKEIIILKYASVVGNMFDLEMLDELNPFNGLTIDELYQLLFSLEQKGILEIMYENSNQRNAVYKFTVPFMREILYQRMLLEQKTDIHLNVARIMQTSKFFYRSSDIDLKLLRMHLARSERTISACMEEDDDMDELEKKSKSTLSFNNLKTYFFREMCNKLNSQNESEDKNLLKSGLIAKKSDKGITWEDRFCAITKTKFLYWYEYKNYKQNKQPLGKFNLKDISSVQPIGDLKFSKKNAFSITVNQWFKKDEVKLGRSFIFAADSREDLMNWMTSLNFLCLNSFYEDFTTNFGIIHLPLNVSAPIEKKYKKKFSQLVPPKHNQINSNCIMLSLFHSSGEVKKISDISRTSRKLSTAIGGSSNYFADSEVEIFNPQKEDDVKNFISSLFSMTFLAFFACIQDKIYKFSYGFNSTNRISIPAFIKKSVDFYDSLITVKFENNQYFKQYFTPKNILPEDIKEINLDTNENENLNQNEVDKNKDKVIENNNLKINNDNISSIKKDKILIETKELGISPEKEKLKQSLDDKNNLKKTTLKDSNDFDKVKNFEKLEKSAKDKNNVNDFDKGILKNEKVKNDDIEKYIEKNSREFSKEKPTKLYKEVNHFKNNDRAMIQEENYGMMNDNSKGYQGFMSLSKGFPTLMNFQGFQGFPNMSNKQPNTSKIEDDDISNIPNFHSNIEMNNKINIIDIDSDYEENKHSFTKKNLLVNHFANSMKSNNDINYDSEEKNNQSHSDEENIIESMNKRKEEIKKMSIMEGVNYKSKNKSNNLDHITNPKTHKTNIFQKWLDYHVKDNK